VLDIVSTLRLLALLRGQGTPKNLQCALPGSDFHGAQRSRPGAQPASPACGRG